MNMPLLLLTLPQLTLPRSDSHLMKKKFPLMRLKPLMTMVLPSLLKVVKLSRL